MRGLVVSNDCVSSMLYYDGAWDLKDLGWDPIIYETNLFQIVGRHATMKMKFLYSDAFNRAAAG